MHFTSFQEGDKLTIALTGEIDHHCAKAYIQVIAAKIETYMPEICVLDFRDVTFVDSSGIAVVINALRSMTQIEGKLLLTGISPQPMRVFRASGLDSKSSNEAFARSAVACFAAQMDPTLEELGDIRTAVSEAVTNCIVHAYPDKLGTITLRCRILKDNVLDIVIKDKGVGIPDVEQARRPSFTTGGAERSGMGFTIMESFMTTLEITSIEGRGTSVHMRRKLQRRQ